MIPTIKRELKKREDFLFNRSPLYFVGVLFEIGEIKYFAPLSSPKYKHLKMKNSIDFYKIDSGKLGAINFNNMIPIPEQEYTYIDIFNTGDNEIERKYNKLLKN